MSSRRPEPEIPICSPPVHSIPRCEASDAFSIDCRLCSLLSSATYGAFENSPVKSRNTARWSMVPSRKQIGGHRNVTLQQFLECDTAIILSASPPRTCQANPARCCNSSRCYQNILQPDLCYRDDNRP